MVLALTGFRTPTALARPTDSPTPRPPQSSGTILITLIAVEDLGLPLEELVGTCSAPQRPIGPSSWCAQPASRHFGDQQQYEGWAIVDYASQTQTTALFVSQNFGPDRGLWTEIGHADLHDYDDLSFAGHWQNLGDLEFAIAQYYTRGAYAREYGGYCGSAALFHFCDGPPLFSTDGATVIWGFGMVATDGGVTALISKDREGWRAYLVVSGSE